MCVYIYIYIRMSEALEELRRHRHVHLVAAVEDDAEARQGLREVLDQFSCYVVSLFTCL